MPCLPIDEGQRGEAKIPVMPSLLARQMSVMRRSPTIQTFEGSVSPRIAFTSSTLYGFFLSVLSIGMPQTDWGSPCLMLLDKICIFTPISLKDCNVSLIFVSLTQNSCRLVSVSSLSKMICCGLFLPAKVNSCEMLEMICVGLKAEGVSKSMAILSIYRLLQIIILFLSTQSNCSFLAAPTPPAELRIDSSTSLQPAIITQCEVFPW